MRGTREIPKHQLGTLGIIPAHAGNTWFSSWCRSSRRDHPRACGEHGAELKAVVGKQGSSPRMRGTPDLPGSCYRPRRDHPRACGEHRIRPLGHTPRKGSSPRMRGTLFATGNAIRLERIIPAHAGNTSNSTVAVSMPRDHPRACGEHCRGVAHGRPV